MYILDVFSYVYEHRCYALLRVYVNVSSGRPYF